MHNSWGIPHFAKTGRLARALERPPARTDFLPKIFNYADRLFEKNGACDAVVDTVCFVIHEQKQDKPVHVNLIRHAAAFMLFKGYQDVYVRARVEAISRTPMIDLLQPGIVDRLSQLSLSRQPNLRKPSENLEIVEDALWFSELVAGCDREPFMMKPATISDYAARLEALSKE